MNNFFYLSTRIFICLNKKSYFLHFGFFHLISLIFFYTNVYVLSYLPSVIKNIKYIK